MSKIIFNKLKTIIRQQLTEATLGEGFPTYYCPKHRVELLPVFKKEIYYDDIETSKKQVKVDKDIEYAKQALKSHGASLPRAIDIDKVRPTKREPIEKWILLYRYCPFSVIPYDFLEFDEDKREKLIKKYEHLLDQKMKQAKGEGEVTTDDVEFILDVLIHGTENVGEYNINGSTINASIFDKGYPNRDGELMLCDVKVSGQKGLFGIKGANMIFGTAIEDVGLPQGAPAPKMQKSQAGISLLKGELERMLENGYHYKKVQKPITDLTIDMRIIKSDTNNKYVVKDIVGNNVMLLRDIAAMYKSKDKPTTLPKQFVMKNYVADIEWKTVPLTFANGKPLYTQDDIEYLVFILPKKFEKSIGKRPYAISQQALRKMLLDDGWDESAGVRTFPTTSDASHKSVTTSLTSDDDDDDDDDVQTYKIGSKEYAIGDIVYVNSDKQLKWPFEIKDVDEDYEQVTLSSGDRNRIMSFNQFERDYTSGIDKAKKTHEDEFSNLDTQVRRITGASLEEEELGGIAGVGYQEFDDLILPDSDEDEDEDEDEENESKD